MKARNEFRLAIGVVAALGLLATSPVAAREKKRKVAAPPPCPLLATLRIADQASIAGIGSLAGCMPGSIVAAPASPEEYVEPADVRIAPEAEPALRRTGGMTMVSAETPEKGIAPADAKVRAGTVRMARIVPAKDEPVELAAVPALDANGLITSDTILAMRPMSYTTPYDAMISRVAARHRVDPLLLHAVITQESRYKVNATSHAGARGLMQLMPGTARMLGVGAIADAESNVDGGARLLRQLHGRFGDFNLTLAAYNAGEGAVRKYGNQVPPYRETQNYVRQVMVHYNKLVAEQGAAGR